jgi:hypothetical protein
MCSTPKDTVTLSRESYDLLTREVNELSEMVQVLKRDPKTVVINSYTTLWFGSREWLFLSAEEATLKLRQELYDQQAEIVRLRKLVLELEEKRGNKSAYHRAMAALGFK